jgi:hypothetical protein
MAAEHPPLTDDQRKLMNAVPPDGSSVSNPALRRFLRWNNDRYLTARGALLAKGLVIRGPGRGGVIRRTRPDAIGLAETVTAVGGGTQAGVSLQTAITDEKDLYEPMRAVIGRDWAKERGQELLAVEITASRRGGRAGIWSYPDLVTVEVRTYRYVPGKHLEITTFEVKSWNAVNVQGVYEALAHRRAATRSYVMFYIPPEQAAALEPAVADVAYAARMHGVGLVIMGDPHDYDTWDEREEAQRFDPDPERLDNFITVQLTDETANKISKRIR